MSAVGSPARVVSTRCDDDSAHSQCFHDSSLDGEPARCSASGLSCLRRHDPGLPARSTGDRRVRRSGRPRGGRGGRGQHPGATCRAQRTGTATFRPGGTLGRRRPRGRARRGGAGPAPSRAGHGPGRRGGGGILGRDDPPPSRPRHPPPGGHRLRRARRRRVPQRPRRRPHGRTPQRCAGGAGGGGPARRTPGSRERPNAPSSSTARPGARWPFAPRASTTASAPSASSP